MSLVNHLHSVSSIFCPAKMVHVSFGYNRCHSYLGYVSLKEFEELWLLEKAV